MEHRRRPIWRRRPKGRVRRITIVTGMVVAMAFLTAPSGHQTSTTGATKYVQALGTQLLTVLDQAQPQPERNRQLRQLLGEHLHLPLIGRYVLGTAWRQATSQQKDQYQQLFGSWIVHSYARRLKNHQGRVLTVTGTESAGRQDVLIMTRISVSSSGSVEAGWRVRAVGGGFKIIDVMVDGASLALSQRLEFAGVVRGHGIGGLLKRLQEQVAKFEARRS